MRVYEASHLQKGAFVYIHVPISGGVCNEDGTEDEIEYPAGAIAVVERVEQYDSYQGWAVTVSYGGVVNVFDELTEWGQYPFTRVMDDELAPTLATAPYMRDVIAQTLQDLEDMVGGRDDASGSSAYGMGLDDEQHPWHGTWLSLKRAEYLASNR